MTPPVFPEAPDGYFFLAAFFLVDFFAAFFLFLAGIREIPPFSPEMDARSSLQHLGSQGASHTSGRVGRAPPAVKRNPEARLSDASQVERVRLCMDVWKSL